MSLLCRLGLHRFRWPDHRLYPWSVFERFHVECDRGCGARTVWTCYPDTHWSEKHPETR